MSAGRTDGFVSILDPLLLLSEFDVAKVFITEGFENEWFGVVVIEVVAQAGAVSTHVGDKTDMLSVDLQTFIEFLGEGLGHRGAELEAVIGFLLHR